MEFGAAGQNLAISGNKTKKPFLFICVPKLLFSLYTVNSQYFIEKFPRFDGLRSRFFLLPIPVLQQSRFDTLLVHVITTIFSAHKNQKKNRLSGRHCGRDPFWPSHCKPQSKQPWMSASGQLHFRPLHVSDSSHLRICFAFWSLVFRTLLKYEIGYLVALESPVMWRQRIGCKIH